MHLPVGRLLLSILAKSSDFLRARHQRLKPLVELVHVAGSGDDLLHQSGYFFGVARRDQTSFGTPHSVDEHAQLTCLVHAGHQVIGKLLRLGLHARELHQGQRAKRQSQHYDNEKTRCELGADTQIGKTKECHGSKARPA